MRNLILVLGDQLDRRSAVFDGFDSDADSVWMAEVAFEATHVWCHQLRLVAFFAAMRHFRDELRQRGMTVHYHQLSRRPSQDRGSSFEEVLCKDVSRLRPDKLIVLHPGDYRVRQSLNRAAEDLSVELQILHDQHFYCDIAEFQEWARGRKVLRLEDFYREMRRQHNILLDEDGQPVGGAWNYDQDNRETFGREGPSSDLKQPRSFRIDDLTAEVIEMVQHRFADHPGSLDFFDLPVNRKQARSLLREFVKQRLPEFGRYEDAMWSERPFLYHSRLSFALNIHLLNPRECVTAAVEAHATQQAPINSVEGFVRQLLGWREFIRGIYWNEMPAYIERNALGCDQIDVPSFYWDGETEMACVRDSMQSVIRHGYAHHIHRLMVLGLFAQLAGVHPRKFHDWHMAMYADAVDWVSLPNTLGMSQFGDGGIVGSKPYCASGNYIHRMSNYCRGCRYHHQQAVGDDACPFTTLYWDFLQRHRQQLSANNRMVMQLKNLDRKDSKEMSQIVQQAGRLKKRLAAGDTV